MNVRHKCRLAFILLATLLFGSAVAFTFYFFNTHLPYRPLVILPGISKDRLLYNLPHGMYIANPEHEPVFSTRLSAGGPDTAAIGFRDGVVWSVLILLPKTRQKDGEITSKFLIPPLKFGMSRDEVERLLKTKHASYYFKDLNDISEEYRSLSTGIESPWIVWETKDLEYYFMFTHNKLSSVSAYLVNKPL